MCLLMLYVIIDIMTTDITYYSSEIFCHFLSGYDSAVCPEAAVAAFG